MTEDEAIQRFRAAYQDKYGEPTKRDDASIKAINDVAIRALMDADKPLPVRALMDADKPLPVDPDLLLARKIVADEFERDGCHNMAAGALDGSYDDWRVVRIALAGIRAGKAMR